MKVTFELILECQVSNVGKALHVLKMKRRIMGLGAEWSKREKEYTDEWEGFRCGRIREGDEELAKV